MQIERRMRFAFKLAMSANLSLAHIFQIPRGESCGSLRFSTGF